MFSFAAIAAVAYGAYKLLGPSKELNADEFEVVQPDDYNSLRKKASIEAEKRNKCFSLATKAYEQGEKKKAKELSDEGKQHDKCMKTLNSRACELIFATNNKKYGTELHTLDLHGLFVKEALVKAEKHLLAAKAAHLKQTLIITGKGNNSPNQVAKLKPAIEQFLIANNMKATVSDGAIVVDLSVAPAEAGWSWLGSCTIM